MRRERAEHLIELGKQAGFDPRGLLACGGAAVRLVAATPSLVRARSEGAVAVIDIGHERTDVVVVAAGKAVFSRSIARAGKQVTEAIMRAPHWRLAWPDAERAKHSDGFVASNAEPATSPAWQQIHQVTITELHAVRPRPAPDPRGVPRAHRVPRQASRCWSAAARGCAGWRRTSPSSSASRRGGRPPTTWSRSPARGSAPTPPAMPRSTARR